MQSFRKICQHVFNPLHVFCRLRQVGVSGRIAIGMCRIYERGFYRHLLG
ncbi:hypothetical protein [Pseudodesulfovibrio sp.]